MQEHGANLGCVLDEVPVLQSLMMVMVNGSSGSGAVSCLDDAVYLKSAGEPTVGVVTYCVYTGPKSGASMNGKSTAGEWLSWMP